MGDGGKIDDIKARDDVGIGYDHEMQMLATVELLRRLLYYWSKIYSQQLTEGDSCRQLRPAISICFVNDIVFPSHPQDFHSAF